MTPFLMPALGVGLSLASQGVNALANMKANAAERRRREQMQAEVDAGQGLTSAQQQTMMNATMQPVRAQAGSMAAELARLQAAGGGLGGGAQMASDRDAMARVVGGSAERAGYRVAAANQDALQQKQDTVAAMAAAQQARRSGAIGGVTGALGQGLAQVGDILGAPPGTFNLSGDVEANAEARRRERERRARMAANGVV